MIEDIVAGILGEATLGRLGRSGRGRVVARLAFGLVGGALAAVGVWHFVRAPLPGAGASVRASAVALFFFLGCFSLFNVALARPWRWPGRLFLASLATLFLARVLLGP